MEKWRNLSPVGKRKVWSEGNLYGVVLLQEFFFTFVCLRTFCYLHCHPFDPRMLVWNFVWEVPLPVCGLGVLIYQTYCCSCALYVVMLSSTLPNTLRADFFSNNIC